MSTAVFINVYASIVKDLCATFSSDSGYIISYSI